MTLGHAINDLMKHPSKETIDANLAAMRDNLETAAVQHEFIPYPGDQKDYTIVSRLMAFRSDGKSWEVCFRMMGWDYG